MLITYQTKLLAKKELTEHVYLASFSWPNNPEWNFQAGQYMIFHVPQPDNHPVRRLYSIASAPSYKQSLNFIIEIVPNGIGSTYIHNLEIGQETTLQGPAGAFTFKSQDRTPVFLATGTGIAPIYSMVYELLTHGYDKPIYLYWGLKTKQDIYCMDEFNKLASEHSNLSMHVCLSREGEIKEEASLVRCMTGHVNNSYEQMLVEKNMTPQSFDYYLCGSKHVVESLREYLGEKGIAKEQVYFEKFTT